ncbi:hypothetical protein J4470_01745 [Candidatus Woesearchaeota archaeon]|nr:hypothetical protein [Candidatus Woesearchaeota archaeon]
MRTDFQTVVLVLVMLGGIYSLDYAYSYSEDAVFGKHITGAQIATIEQCRIEGGKAICIEDGRRTEYSSRITCREKCGKEVGKGIIIEESAELPAEQPGEAAGRADLVAMVDVESPLAVNETYVVNVFVKNIGKANTKDSAVEGNAYGDFTAKLDIFKKEGEELDSVIDTMLFSWENVNDRAMGIAANTERTRPIIIQSWKPEETGVYLIKVELDVYGQIIEGDEGNVFGEERSVLQKPVPCSPVGFRNSGFYCNGKRRSVRQKEVGSCRNGYECLSNVCSSGKCVSEPAFRSALCDLGAITNC